MNRKSFASSQVIKDSKDKKMKLAEMEQNALKSVIDVVQKSEVLSLEDILKHRVTEENTALFNPDGSLRKTAKSQLITKMNTDLVQLDEDYIAVVDMGMIWRLCLPAIDERSPDSDEKYKWNDYHDNVAKTLVARHPRAKMIISVNDDYTVKYTIKDEERQRREKSRGNIPNEFFKPEDEFPSRVKFNKILQKPENKIRLQERILKAIEKKAQVSDVSFLYYTAGKCINVGSREEVEYFEFNHAEADTIMPAVYCALREHGYKEPIEFDVADTDVYASAANVAHQYPQELYIKRVPGYVNCKTLVDHSMIDCIVPFHEFTGGDSTASFYGKGKGKLFDKVMKSDRAKEQLEHLGEDLELEEDCAQELMKFTREVVYGDFHSCSMTESRANKWRGQKDKSFCRLPPDEDSLRQKLKRANYTAYLALNPKLKEHPDPVGNGWLVENSLCRPKKYLNPPLPDMISAQMAQGHEETEVDEMENNNRMDCDDQNDQEQPTSESESDVGDEVEAEENDTDDDLSDGYSDTD